MVDATELEPGAWLVRGSIWLALVCYPAGPLAALFEGYKAQLARGIWSLGCLAFLAHVASSFQVFYDWSHGIALGETARQAKEVTGLDTSAGIYLNYLFTLVWLVDAVWWWRNEAGYQRRPRLAVLAVHGFCLFMIFNATVVFETGAVRLLGLVVVLLGGFGVWKTTRPARVTV
ncbi:MAG: hypothetical protein VYE73_11900 [Acidobacteriota bacterium]|nr:hypothetical protein [Acidobacteriota bacterium]